MRKNIIKKEDIENLDKFGKKRFNKEIKERSKIAEKKISTLFDGIHDKSKTPYEMGYNDAILTVAIDNAVFCYSLGLDSHCIVELYGVIEYFIIRTLKDEFFTIKTSNELKNFLDKEKYDSEVEYFLRKIKTRDLVLILKKIGALDNKDLKSFEKLENLRNCFAHKNVVRLSKYIDIRKIPNFFEIDTPEIKIDAKKHIEDTLVILRKLFTRHRQIEDEKKT